MAKRGRKSIYETVILENLDQIKRWISQGATEKQICEALGISVSAFNAHKEKDELNEAIKTGRSKLIMDLRGELVRQAMKHTLESTKTYIEKDDNGNEKKKIEKVVREVDGNISALHLLLKNLDRDEWKNDWNDYEFRKMEMELKKMQAEDKSWGAYAKEDEA